MKKWIRVLVLVMICGMCTCCKRNDESESTDKDISANEVSDKSDTAGNEEEEETQVDAMNRSMIAKALGIEEDARNIRFIISSLNVIQAGQIQAAEMVEVEGGKVIDVVAEDDKEYRIYLSGSGSVEAVENLTTGEWPVQSNR